MTEDRLDNELERTHKENQITAGNAHEERNRLQVLGQDPLLEAAITSPRGERK